MGDERFINAEVITHAHAIMARAGLGLTIRQLANESELDKATIVRFEAGYSVREETADKIRRALEEYGAEFFLSNKSRKIAVCIHLKQGAL
ncbi:MAG: helix-turn-helix domain-containing protein [Marinicaulis sp.]|nr:helix-turn-helix domain-containing protein [Marinicaulis sp.]NNL88751.1 helix-turn-helix domain-containing protein [Marinicaulis sp.]